jgi:hypothetical protein
MTSPRADAARKGGTMPGEFEREAKIGPRPDVRPEPKREPIAAPDRHPRRPVQPQGPVGPADGSFGKPSSAGHGGKPRTP